MRDNSWMIRELSSQYGGQWILPGLITDSVGGQATVQNGIRLTIFINNVSPELEGAIWDALDLRAVGSCQLSVTLVGGHCVKGDTDTGEFEFEFHSAFIGQAIYDAESEVFDSAMVVFDYVDAWAARRNIEHIPHEHAGKSGIYYDPPGNLTAHIGGGEVELWMRQSTKHGQRNFSVSGEEVFVLTPPAAVDLDSLLRDWVSPIHYLIALSVGPNPAMRQLIVDNSVRTKPNFRSIERPAIYVSSYDNLTDVDLRVARHGMLVTLKDLQFDVDVPKWFSIVKKYQSACDLIFSRTLGDQNLTAQFFGVATAVEAIHHRLFPGAGKKTEGDIQQLDRILSSVDAADRDWVDSKLKFAYDPSYRQRLNAILDHVGPAVDYLARPAQIGGREQLVKWVVEYRNRIAHSRSLDKIDWEKLFYVDLALNAILRLTLLRELGWEKDRCHAAAMRHNRAWFG